LLLVTEESFDQINQTKYHNFGCPELKWFQSSWASTDWPCVDL